MNEHNKLAIYHNNLKMLVSIFDSSLTRISYLILLITLIPLKDLIII